MEESNAINTKTRRATGQDLEGCRPLIEQYYEKKSLLKVMDIMESRHGLKGTSVHLKLFKISLC